MEGRTSSFWRSSASAFALYAAMVLVRNRRLRSPGMNKPPTIDIDHPKVREACAAIIALLIVRDKRWERALGTNPDTDVLVVGSVTGVRSVCGTAMSALQLSRTNGLGVLPA